MVPPIWVFPRDPDFAAKTAVVLDLPAASPATPLTEAEFVICADEKASIQARLPLPPGHGARGGHG